MKITANKDACIGCGACEAIAPTYFELNEERLVVVKTAEVADGDADSVTDACGSCPTAAISAE